MNRKHVQQFLPNIHAIEESVIEYDGRTAGFHCSVRLKDGSIFGSGCSREQNTARVIGVAEAIERTIFNDLINNAHLRAELLLDEYPTTCGFAIGNDAYSAVHRAQAEAVERWLRSKWIDDGYKLEECALILDQSSELSRFLYFQFDNVLAFRSTNRLLGLDGTTHSYHSLIVVGLKAKGAFVGSRTCQESTGLEEHALVEAWRHLQISNHIDEYPDTFDFRQIHYFGTNAGVALAQIHAATRPQMPEPKLRLLKAIDTQCPDLFLYRALCRDFRGWHGPDHTRFVY